MCPILSRISSKQDWKDVIRTAHSFHMLSLLGTHNFYC
jgi:hypothetical protein